MVKHDEDRDDHGFEARRTTYGFRIVPAASRVPKVAEYFLFFCWLPALLLAIFLSNSFDWQFNGLDFQPTEPALIVATLLTAITAVWPRSSVQSQISAIIVLLLSMGAIFFRFSGDRLAMILGEVILAAAVLFVFTRYASYKPTA